MKLEIRRARESDAATLTEIAYESKRYWGYPDHWMLHWRDALTITSAYITERIVYVAEAGASLVGFYAVVGAHAQWELDHLCIRPDFIGHGIGRQLFRHAAAYLAVQDPGAILGIESEPNAEQFYVRMGARRVREVTREWHGVRRTLPYLEFRVEAVSNRDDG